MSQPEVFILHCSVSASVRQSIQIAFEDYKLPDDVIDTLKSANAMSIRPKLSNGLKRHLDELRLMQRYLYDRCTIHHGDVHFIHPDHFDEAMTRIDEIKAKAIEFNAQLKDSWSEEYERWNAMVDNFFSPLFSDKNQLALVREAYLKMFPTAKEFAAPICVDVVGPYPASLERVDDPQEAKDFIQNAAALNTQEVLEAAQSGAMDRSMGRIAELLDDLDARPANKVGDRVLSNNPKKRGSWQIIGTELALSSTHNPSLKGISNLVQRLIECGETMRDEPKGPVRIKAFQRYAELRQEIRDEARAITAAADSSKGFEALQMSLSMSNTYKDLLINLENCESLQDLENIENEIETQTSVYKHRAKHLQAIHNKARERLEAVVNIEAAIEELKTQEITSEEDCGF